MPTPKTDNVKPRKKKDSEHIFPATELTKMALRWKELHAAGRHTEAMALLEEIIKGSTSMFHRLAQHEGYNNTVDLDVLTSHASEKVIKWLLCWRPSKGRLFSWFSKCAKNSFRSEVIKQASYKARYHVTSDNLEKFYGADDPEINRHNLAEELREKVREITVRWGCPQEHGVLQFMLESLMASEEPDKFAIIRSASYAWGVSPELAKFFYGWCVMELRNIMHRRIHFPFTEQDLFRQQYSYTYLVDLLQIITWPQLKQIIITMGGTRLKIPTITQLAKANESYRLREEIDESDLDPDSIERIAKKKKKSGRTAQAIYEELTDMLHPDRSGEHDLYASYYN